MDTWLPAKPFTTRLTVEAQLTRIRDWYSSLSLCTHNSRSRGPKVFGSTDLRHDSAGWPVRHLRPGHKRNTEVVLPVVYIQGASIFTMGRWGVGCLKNFANYDLYFLVTKTNLSLDHLLVGATRRKEWKRMTITPGYGTYHLTVDCSKGDSSCSET